VTQGPRWIDAVSDLLFELFRFWEAFALGARENHDAVELHFEHAANSWLERELEFGRKRGQELLSHPGGAAEPAALGAVANSHGHTWLRGLLGRLHSG
jgi:hypothetical protein